jgi:Leucine-rich repeat (LRR) protein
MNDEELARIVALCDGLHTLEIDEYSGSKVSLSSQGLRCLQDLPGLKRLRLGKCNLTAEHLEAIAELKQLEELSLEDAGVVDKTVEPLKKLPKLRRISLERTNVSKGMFSEIGGDWNDRRPWRS